MGLLSARERVIWASCFVLVAAALVLTRFTSSDGDSALYTGISARLADRPAADWIAPFWFGLWPTTGQHELFIENPAGIFVVPAALDRLGVPPGQAPYIVGTGAGLLCLLVLAGLVRRLASHHEARAALVMLQLMPVAFVFRIRANHEYPMLLCLLLTLVGLDGVKRSWAWLPLVMLGFAGGLVVKGAFVGLIVLAACLWVLVDPTGPDRRAVRQWAAFAAGVVALVVVALAYDAAYLRVTGQTFWWPYLVRQLGPVTIASPLGDAGSFTGHLGFYALRLLWHPAPWSFALVWVAWRRLRRGRLKPSPPAPGVRALWFVLAFAGVVVVLLSLPNRLAERYAFSATYLVGAAGAVAAYRAWPGVQRTLDYLDRIVPALPATTWLVLMLLRVVLGPWLPRLEA
jgi:4-amino-4-deoxy-L-arabinose transferase-like glycosyltransferase